MLAVQRPSMGSSKPLSGGPFGYDFGDAPEYPFDAPPEPAPGSSILTDGDSKYLGSFFDGLNTNDFGAGTSMFADGFGTNEDSGYWNATPPQFVGSSTSFGQQPHFMGNDMHTLNFADLNGNTAAPQDMLSQNPSADVLAAAATLHNGHNGRGHSIASAPMFAVPSTVAPHGRSQSMMYDQSSIRDPFFTDMMFGSAPIAGQKESRRTPQPLDIKWGTDAGFGARFIPPSGQDEIARVQQNQAEVMDCLLPDSSTADNTRPNSPIITRRPTSKQQNDHESAKDDGAIRAKKRRKSEPQKEEVEETEPNGQSQKKRRPKSIGTTLSTPAASKSPPPSASKRRKSAASSAVKPIRENLTEIQKRENHIKSEQKRRTLIKEGFDDLNELVPDLRSGGFSKSAVLTMTGDFLENLIEGNKELRRRLAELEGS